MATLVDSNVILDVVSDDEEWGDWSASMLSEAAQAGRLVINPLIYAEISCGYERIEELDDALPPDYFVREPFIAPQKSTAAPCRTLSHPAAPRAPRLIRREALR